jgi:hypothetical protein
MHKTLFQHNVVSAYDLPAVERDGDRTTVNVTGQHGGSFREIIDLSDWDNSVATSVPGVFRGNPVNPEARTTMICWKCGPTVSTSPCCSLARQWRRMSNTGWC